MFSKNKTPETIFWQQSGDIGRFCNFKRYRSAVIRVNGNFNVNKNLSPRDSGGPRESFPFLVSVVSAVAYGEGMFRSGEVI